MGTIVSYLEEYGGYNFIEKPLCEVDGLILAHLSYYVYDGVVPGIEETKPAVTTEYMKENMDQKNFLSVTWEEAQNRELFYKILETRRFRSMKANYYVNAIDKEQSLQFGAITFILGNGDIYIAFRDVVFINQVKMRNCDIFNCLKILYFFNKIVSFLIELFTALK